jgi:hypothetical protein
VFPLLTDKIQLATAPSTAREGQVLHPPGEPETRANPRPGSGPAASHRPRPGPTLRGFVSTCLLSPGVLDAVMEGVG